MKVTVIIPSLATEQTRPYLRLCVESLRATTDWDIIVVTNGIHAEALNIDGITTRLHTRDQGQCNAVNIGVQLAGTSDYIMVSNDDMYYAPGWNKGLDSVLNMDILCFSPNLIEPTNNPGSATPFLKLDAGFNLDEFKREVVDDFVKQNAGKGIYEPGFNLPFFIKRDFFNFLGGYDTAYDPWGSNSDTDLQTRINLAGRSPLRFRQFLVYHFSNKSGTFDGTHQDFYQNNIEYFHQKFGFDRDELGSDVWMNNDMLPTDETKIKYRQEKYDKHNS